MGTSLVPVLRLQIWSKCTQLGVMIQAVVILCCCWNCTAITIVLYHTVFAAVWCCTRQSYSLIFGSEYLCLDGDWFFVQNVVFYSFSDMGWVHEVNDAKKCVLLDPWMFMLVTVLRRQNVRTTFFMVCWPYVPV